MNGSYDVRYPDGVWRSDEIGRDSSWFEIAKISPKARRPEDWAPHAVEKGTPS